MPKIVDEGPPNGDKILHGTAYFFFCILWFMYFFLILKRDNPFGKNLIIAACWSLFFGMVIEILQSEFTTYRTGDFLDMLANSTGILLGVLALFILKNTLIRLKTKILISD
ncbi:MAG: VanZ family protein [Leeuwenhoekiella sp.]